MSRYVRPALIVSVAYLPLAILLSSGEIWIGFTLVLIAVNAWISMAVLFGEGRIPPEVIGLTAFQLVLFGLLHWQIFQFSGSGHYRFQHPPIWIDWGQLVAAHGLRAVDVVDAFAAYGVRLQNVHNNSMQSGSLLVIMHVLVDVFLFGTLLGMVHRSSALQEFGRVNKTLIQRLKTMRLALLGATLAAFFYSFLLYLRKDPYRADKSDLLLWPLDNMLRVVDFGDAFQIFGWQLHSVPMTTGLATLAVVYRFLVGTWAVSWVDTLYLHVFKGKGQTVSDLAALVAAGTVPLNERVIAARALAKLGPHGAGAVSQIAPLLATGPPPLRVEVEKALQGMKSAAVSPLASCLSSPNPEVSRQVTRVLERIDPDWQRSEEAGRVSPQLIAALMDADLHVRHSARLALERIDPDWIHGPHAAATLQAAVEALFHWETGVRQGAAETLAWMGPKAAGASFRLVRLLTDTHGHARHAAAAALERVDPHWRKSPGARNAMPFLARQLTDEEPEIRDAATEAFRSIGAPAVAVLAETLAAPDSQAAVAAVRALAGIGAPAAGLLVGALSHADGGVSAAAAQALERLGPTAVPALVGRLQLRPGKQAAAAGRVLLKIGPASIPPLATALASAQDPDVKRTLIAVLGWFGPAARGCVPQLRTAAGDPALTRTAAQALRRIRPPKPARA